MTDYTWPTSLIPNSSSLAWIDNSQRFRSTLSGVTRRVTRPGGHWRLTLQFSGLTAAQAQTLEAFLWRLNGASHTAVIPDHAYRMQGAGGGTPIVDGASQTGRVLLTSGWSPGVTVLKAGDRVQVENQMYVIAADVLSSGSPADIYLKDEDGNILYDESSPQQPILIDSGGAQLYFTAPIRTSPANGASIVTASPTARYILANVVESAALPGVYKSVTVEFEEAIDA